MQKKKTCLHFIHREAESNVSIVGPATQAWMCRPTMSSQQEPGIISQSTQAYSLSLNSRSYTYTIRNRRTWWHTCTQGTPCVPDTTAQSMHSVNHCHSSGGVADRTVSWLHREKDIYCFLIFAFQQLSPRERDMTVDNCLRIRLANF